MDKNNKSTNDVAKKNRTEFADELNNETDKKSKSSGNPEERK